MASKDCNVLLLGEDLPPAYQAPSQSRALKISASLTDSSRERRPCPSEVSPLISCKTRQRQYSRASFRKVDANSHKDQTAEKDLVTFPSLASPCLPLTPP